MQKERPIPPEDDAVKSVVTMLSTQYGMRDFRPLGGGHTGATLMMCVDAQSEARVVKFGTTDISIDEVRNNIYGYQKIAEASGIALLPKGLQTVVVDTTEVVLMPYLGHNVSDRAKQDPRVFQDFCRNIEPVFTQSIVSDRSSHIAGLQTFINQMASWYARLVDEKMLEVNILEVIKSVDVGRLSGDKASLMIFDFTPDNVFVVGSDIAFIDPWYQESYVGTCIPSLGQFAALARDVYQLPGSAQAVENIYDVAQQIGDAMGLDATQIQQQFALGQSLQFALSSFVRIHTDPIVSLHFAQRSSDLLSANL